MPQIVLSEPEELATPAGWARLGERWRALEAVAECSFFQSWSWVGCRVAERFPDPVLLEAREAGETVALALFNRRRGLLGSSLHLNETGDGTHDSPFVEHNGLLVRRGFEAVVAPCLAAALHGFGRRVVLGGVGGGLAAVALVAPGCAVVRQVRPAPYVDLVAIRAAGGGYEASLSANTRQQVRRSARGYGAIRAVRAADVAEGLGFLDSLAALHQAYWTGRGRAGAFAAPFFGAFHRELVTIALPRGEAELWRIAADGDNVLGYLYNFRWRDQIAAYQSGFSYPSEDSRRKPGLTSHAAAIEFALAEGLGVYDFLGGGDRYKTSLGNSRRDLHWLELGPCWRPAALLARLSTRQLPVVNISGAG